MQFQTLVLAAFAAVAAAQTSPTLPTSTLPSRTQSSPTTTATSNLVALVQGLPSCGIKCLSDAAKQANCAATDLKCLCSNAGSLTSNISLISCVASNCNSDQQAKLVSDAPQVCDKLNNNPNPAEVSSASSIVASALGTAGVTNTRSTALAPRRTDAPALAAMGGVAAAFAAYALFFFSLSHDMHLGLASETQSLFDDKASFLLFAFFCTGLKELGIRWRILSKQGKTFDLKARCHIQYMKLGIKGRFHERQEIKP
ncbi:hypothetical protein RB595_006129 [Gaeumannomyces hyphopodioides]